MFWMREVETKELGSYEGVLWRVLAALARGGYAVPPSDARDLIHDFYLDAWNGVNERFDPKLGVSFVAYIASAFYRFARRRILKSESFNRRTVDFDSAVAHLSSDATPPDILESRERHQSASAALALLTPLERTVLEGHLSGDGVSERELAQRHKLSRYGVREVLADSLGKVAVSLGRTPAASKHQENIAELLWKYGQSPRDVAALLDMPVAEVQSARNQVVAALLAEIRHPNRSPVVGSVKMKHEEALKLLTSAIGSSGNRKSLEEVRKHRAEIQHALDQGDLLIDEQQWSQLEANPEWLAQVYESLADTQAEPEPTDISKTIAALREQEEREIGEAFGALIGDLPLRFHHWREKWFKGLPEAPADYRNQIAQRISVLFAGAPAFDLTHYGLTPETIYAATRGLKLLFNRTERAARAGDLMEPFTVRPERLLPKSVQVDYGHLREPVAIPDALILAEVSSTPHLPVGAGFGLTSWLMEALQFKPYLIEGYSAHVDRQVIALQRTAETREGAIQRGDLISLWTRGRPMQLPYAASMSSAG
jgi:RNA polymerase sigma factor (sigma-70 family)